MGVLNATPDSFSDGGQFVKKDFAIKQAVKMLADGASIIDVGGESTRPGAKPVSLQQEMDRVIPIIEKISADLNVCISVDTSSPEVMLAAKKAGAHMLNDVRALTRKGALRAALETELPVCLMHMQGEPNTMQSDPQYSQVVNEVYSYLAGRIAECAKIGIPKGRLLVDPGFGFGKSLAHNYQLLSQLGKLLDLGVPVLAGLSRKSMIGAALVDQMGVDRNVTERLFGSVSGAVIAAMNGARIIRVHDVKETVDAMRIVHASLSA
ncbi:MAG: dihydropteroate synthase [Bermanella sp.]|jgi:dihydropteroate synthase